MLSGLNELCLLQRHDLRPDPYIIFHDQNMESYLQLQKYDPYIRCLRIMDTSTRATLDQPSTLIWPYATYTIEQCIEKILLWVWTSEAGLRLRATTLLYRDRLLP